MACFFNAFAHLKMKQLCDFLALFQTRHPFLKSLDDQPAQEAVVVYFQVTCRGLSLMHWVVSMAWSHAFLNLILI